MPRAGVALIFLLLPVIGVLDQISGSDYGFSLFYLLPVVALAYFSGHRLGIAAAVIAGTFWVIATILDQRAVGSVDVTLVAWNGLTRYAIYIGAVSLIALQRRARETAEEAVRTRDRFLSVAAHELQGPVNTIAARVQLAIKHLDRQDDNASVRVQLATLLATTRRLQEVARNLFDIRQFQRGGLALRVETFDLAALVRELVDVFTTTGAPGRTIRVDAPPTLVISADPRRIDQVIANLIDNALKYSPDGDDVVVVVERASDAVHLSVRDYGIGIAPEARERIFDSGSQESPHDFAGMGIGLAVVREILRLHKGDVRVEAAVGGGSRFIVRLPLPHAA